ncbi:MAG TPA: efflux RND transporter periplasmic adaptor subunit [Smithella sp.]|nr:efflux RND transporter periplasmic adaptor subunit [Smithella sp.]
MNGLLRRKILIVGVALAVAILLVYGFWPKTREVDLAVVKRGPLQIVIEEEGRTRLKDRFTVSAPAAGYLRRIELEVGDTVKKGQVVAVLEPMRSPSLDPRSRATAEAAVTASEAALQAAIQREKASASDVAYLKQRRERFKALYEKGAVTKDQVDQIVAETEKAEALLLSSTAAVQMAKAQFEEAKATLRNFSREKIEGGQESVTIASPVSGSVFRVYHESEGAVNAGEPLMDIGNVADLEIRAELLSSDAVKIKEGTKVLLKHWGGEQTLAGKVRRVEPAGFTKISSLGVEEQRTLVLVDITSPRPLWQKLGDGYRLEAHFVVWEDDNVLQIPASALFRSGSDWAVFVAEKGKVRKRIVEVGQRSGLAAQVLSGLRENEKVIAYPDDSIADGTSIKPRK